MVNDISNPALVHFLDASITHAIAAAINIASATPSMMTDISSLENQAGALNKAINFWNTLNVWTLALALIIGALSFVAQRQVITASRELNDVSDRLAKAKEDQLQRDLKSKDVQIADTNERARGLEKEAEQARLKTAELQSLVSWRTLSEKQINILQTELGPTPSAVEFIAMDNDPESQFFGAMIARGFKGWQLVSSLRTYSGKILFGVFIFGPSENEVRRVRDAFTAADIPFFTTEITGNFRSVGAKSFSPLGVTVIVGSKPRPEKAP